MDIEKKVWEVLCSEEDLNKRVKELGEQITEDYKDKNLMVISLLRGSFVFCADLVRAIDLKTKVDFMTTQSYGDGFSTSGNVEVVNDIKGSLEGYDVLVVDDITDSALTMDYVLRHLKEKNPKSIKSWVLLDKPSRRNVELVPDYCGFTIEDKFVVGYGLNYGDHYINITYVFVVNDKDR